MFHQHAEKLLKQLLEIKMSITALDAAVAQLTTDVNSLVAVSAASVPQSQVDAVTASVTALDATVVAAVAAATPAPPAAAAPAAPAASAPAAS